MKKAMYNVEKNYAVVGVLEDMNKTLTVLEHYVPRSVILYKRPRRAPLLPIIYFMGNCI